MRRPRHRQHNACPKAGSPGLALRQSLPPAPPRPLFLHQVLQSVHDAFVRLATRVGHVYNRREEDVEQKGREHAPLAKTLFHSEPPQAHPVVEPHACSHAIVELTNDWDHIMWHAKTDTIAGYAPVGYDWQSCSWSAEQIKKYFESRTFND